MKTDIQNIKRIVIKQIENLYGVSCCEEELIKKHIEYSVIRTERCFSHLKNKYYQEGGVIPTHSGKYFTFLYFLANTIYKEEIVNGIVNPTSRQLCDKLYCINKMLNMCEAYYEIEMPEIFFVEHPLGTVLGRAKYGNRFTVYQGCTVGANELGQYPTIGNNVILFSDAKVLGNSNIGDNVIVAANTYIKDEDIPSNCIVFGQTPQIVIKTNQNEKIMKWMTALFNY